MKKFLLSFALALLCLVSSAQVQLSELYVNPQPSGNIVRHEYFELYNNTGVTENLNCYTLITFFNTNDEAGFYVLDLPEVDIPSGGTFVGAAASPFLYQGTTGGDPASAVPDFNWNQPGPTAQLTKYTLNDDLTAYTKQVIAPTTDPDEIVNNIFVESSLFDNQVNPKVYGVVLLKNDEIVDIFFARTTGTGAIVTPEQISVPDLSIDAVGDCPDFTLDIRAQAVNIAASLIDLPPAGPTNGYFFQFCDEDEWDLASTPDENTPGIADAPEISEEIFEQLTFATSVLAECAVTPTPVTVSIGTDELSPLPANFEGTSATVNLYLDDGDGILEPTDQLIGSDIIENLPGTVTIEDATPRTGEVFYLVEVVFDAICQSIVIPTPPCSVAPVTFSSFTVNRSKTNVTLNWSTATEQDNKGFNIQRKQGGTWETIAFIPTKASNGNSNSDLQYSYTDVNNYSGVSQYRLEQIDYDGDKDYSEVRSVNGNAQAAKIIVYPNPSLNGKVNVAFSDMVVRDLLLTDMSGRLVKQWKGHRNTSLLIDNLQSGVYTLRIKDITSGTQTTEKIVVNR